MHEIPEKRKGIKLNSNILVDFKKVLYDGTVLL